MHLSSLHCFWTQIRELLYHILLPHVEQELVLVNTAIVVVSLSFSFVFVAITTDVTQFLPQLYTAPLIYFTRFPSQLLRVEFSYFVRLLLHFILSDPVSCFADRFRTATKHIKRGDCYWWLLSWIDPGPLYHGGSWLSKVGTASSNPPFDCFVLVPSFFLMGVA